MGMRDAGLWSAMRGLAGGCRRVRPLLVASLYEPLGEDEEQALRQHLEKCGLCRAEWSGMLRTVAAIPREPARLSGDMAPALLARAAECSNRAPVRRLLPYGAAATAIVAALLFVVAGPFASSPVSERLATAPMPAVAVEPPAATVSGGATDTELPAGAIADSPVEEAVCEAEQLVEKHAYADAMQLLQESMAAHPGDPASGVAQARLAEIEFCHLRRYPRAFDAYVRLRNLFPETFKSSPESIDRFDLLVEGWQENFEALYALDAARGNGPAGFADLESVVAQYPGKLVAGVALDEMRRIVDGPGAEGDMPVTAALERVRARCANPVAVAQVNLRLGDAYSQDARNLPRAREMYQDVSRSAHPVLAPMADAALARLANP